MNIWHDISGERISKEKFVAVIEISKGCKNKYELDKQLTRYEKNDNVCLKVIKKNGKIASYHVSV